MPCSRGMSKCRDGCLHRSLVYDYRIERHHQEIEREAATSGYASEIESYNATHDMITFKKHLKGRKQPHDR